MSVGVPGLEPGVPCSQSMYVSLYTTPRVVYVDILANLGAKINTKIKVGEPMLSDGRSDVFIFI